MSSALTPSFTPGESISEMTDAMTLATFRRGAEE
jgi:hypothetical protein